MNDNLAVEWTHTGTVSGLLRAIFLIPAACHAGEARLLIDGAEAWRGAIAPHFDGRVHLNIHTHLIADGARELKLVVDVGDSISASATNVLIKNRDGVSAITRGALSAHGLPIAYSGDCDAGRYESCYRDITPWIESPHCFERADEMLRAGEIDAAEHAMLIRFLRDGYVVMDQRLPEEMIVSANEAIDRAVEQGYMGYCYGDSTRLEQMHMHYSGIRDIWLYQPVHRFLSIVFGAPSQACQSLVYVFGSQQDAHQDTVHLTPFPAGLMCGVWVALEDVREGSGELMVYPGSHRLPRVYMHSVGCDKVRGDWRDFGEKVVGRWSELLDESGIQPVPYFAERGQILVWHENLMHAGSVRRDKSLSRRSVVTHNFAKGTLVYYDASGNVGFVSDTECA